MSAIQALLRVMTLRDAEAIVLEAGKIPTLRRRGQAEQLAMAPLDAQLLADFAAPLLAGRSVDEGAVSVTFGEYRASLERGAHGLRMVAKPAPPAAAHAPATMAPAAGAAVPPKPAYAPAVVAAAAAADAAHAPALLAALLRPFIAEARARGASDAIVSTGGARLRVDGRLEPLDVPVDAAALAACVAAAGPNTDHSLEVDGVRLRVNAFDHLTGTAIAARLVRDQPPSLADLGLPPELAALVDHRDGLVLACGPTGSGKSTTLAALVDALDQRRAAHVITLEDPIEYRFAGRSGVGPRRCLVHQRELGMHIPSFAAGLRAALREAPDVILLGELRDKETIAAALTAAETGHLVLATLHAPNAVGAIDRIIDAFSDHQQRQVRWQLAASLRAVVTQYLLPRRDGGRAAAIELAPITAAVANLIRKGDLHHLPNAIQTGRDAGMIPLERSLARLVDSGAVAQAAARAVVADHDLFAALSGNGPRRP